MENKESRREQLQKLIKDIDNFGEINKLPLLERLSLVGHISKALNFTYASNITPEAVPDLVDALKDCLSDLFYQIESKVGPEKASQYPSIVKAREAIEKAK